MRVTLSPHPNTPSFTIDQIEVEVRLHDRRPGIAVLDLIYRGSGNLERVRLPKHAGFARRDGLWRHTCFEAFLKAEDGTGYLEVNAAPSGEWATYVFDNYREGMRDGRSLMGLESWSEAGRIIVESVINLDELYGKRRPSLRLALSAVIEDVDGRISYWALAHPSDKPDFHHPDSFVLELP